MGRKLGQHFLKNNSALSESARIITSYHPSLIVEIGPGHGELTIYLKNQISHLKNEIGMDAERKIKSHISHLKKNPKIVAIEKDGTLAEKLRERFKKTNGIEIIEGDALKILPKIISSSSKKYVIAGNIPYSITGRLLRLIGDAENKPEAVILIIQKEVAERITAEPPHMNLLAACTRVWAKPRIVRIISRKDFSPRPNVDSALIVLETKEKKTTKHFYAAARILFSHPRKTVLNNLSSAFPRKEAELILNSAGIENNARPQNLSIETVASIAKIMYNNTI